jgi:uncharacterized protein YndB with AHSA1/START domain
MIDPIRRSITVACPPAHAFEVFTRGMGSWWPLDDVHTRSRERADAGVKAEGVVLEPYVGGRVYETLSDGSEAGWGTILVFDEPHRLVLAWKPNSGPYRPTEVDVEFIERDDGSTRVDLEHRGWERLGADGAESRSSYLRGWQLPFDERFGRAAAETA